VASFGDFESFGMYESVSVIGDYKRNYVIILSFVTSQRKYAKTDILISQLSKPKGDMTSYFRNVT
jgi:hypothetical protein